MIPQRTLSGECEITTGAFSITKRPPVYTGESAALNVQVAFKFQGVDYTLPSGVVAEMYLRYPNTALMTVAVEMEKSGNTASGVLSAEQAGVAGYPLLVIQLTDMETSALIVACATAVKVSDVRGDLVIDSRAPSPSEIIYIGRSPYINPTNGHWMQWDISTNAYVDTEVVARGLPATFTAYAETLPEGSDATASIEGTALNPVVKVGVPKGDKGNTGDTGPAAGFGTPTASVDSNVGTPSVNVTASGPATAKVFNFAFHNLKGQKGDTGDVASVNGQTGAVQLNDEHIPSTVDGKANVEAVLSYHSQQIDDLGPNNTLTSDSTTAALSAAQGKALKTLIDNAFSFSGKPEDMSIWQAIKNCTPGVHVRGFYTVPPDVPSSYNLGSWYYELVIFKYSAYNNITNYDNAILFYPNQMFYIHGGQEGIIFKEITLT